MNIIEICPTTTQNWITKGVLLVDVRENEEVESVAFDVPNILHIPLTEFEERFIEIPKDQKVILVCRSGARSLRATGFLINHGYENVANMKHGLIRWVQKGFPTIGDTTSIVNTKNTCCSSSTTSTCC